MFIMENYRTSAWVFCSCTSSMRTDAVTCWQLVTATKRLCFYFTLTINRQEAVCESMNRRELSVRLWKQMDNRSSVHFSLVKSL